MNRDDDVDVLGVGLHVAAVSGGGQVVARTGGGFTRVERNLVLLAKYPEIHSCAPYVRRLGDVAGLAVASARILPPSVTSPATASSATVMMVTYMVTAPRSFVSHGLPRY